MEFSSDFSAGVFGDARLSRRLEAIGRRLVVAPEKSFPGAMETEAELEGLYRFVNNERVSKALILEPHFRETLLRAEGCSELIVPHDTTELGFTTARKGLGRVTDKGRGFFAHASLFVSGDERGEPLGVLELATFIRTGKPKRKQGRHSEYRPEAERESIRWWESIHAVERRLQRPGVAIHVADREADSYVLLSRLRQAEYRFVIRIRADRVLADEEADHSKLFETMEGLKTQAEREVPISARKKKGRKAHPPRESRIASLEIAAGTVTFRLPSSRPNVEDELPKTLVVNVVHVREVNCPPDCEPVDWKLTTTEPINTVEQILKVVDVYRKRWRIEEFFKALKSCCKVEEVQLESLEAILNSLALYIPVASLLLRIRQAAREPTSPPATELLTPLQIQLLQSHHAVRLPPDADAKAAFLGIARLGGHLKRNGPPGFIILARGLLQLLTLEQGAALVLARQKM
jgi:hypothetical protein